MFVFPYKYLITPHHDVTPMTLSSLWWIRRKWLWDPIPVCLSLIRLMLPTNILTKPPLPPPLNITTHTTTTLSSLWLILRNWLWRKRPLEQPHPQSKQPSLLLLLPPYLSQFWLTITILPRVHNNTMSLLYVNTNNARNLFGNQTIFFSHIYVVLLVDNRMTKLIVN